RRLSDLASPPARKVKVKSQPPHPRQPASRFAQRSQRPHHRVGAVGRAPRPFIAAARLKPAELGLELGEPPAKNALPFSNLSAIGSARALLPLTACTSRMYKARSAARSTLSTIAPPLFASATTCAVFHRAAAAATRFAHPSGRSPRTLASSST